MTNNRRPHLGRILTWALLMNLSLFALFSLGVDWNNYTTDQERNTIAVEWE